MVFSAIPQVITEDRASGAQVFEGSLAIDNDKSQYLRKAFSGLGNTRTFTWSSWVRRSSFGDWQRIFTCEPGSNLIAGLSFTGAVSGSYPINGIRIQQQDTDGNNNHFRTTSVYRDTGWYHIVMRVDTTSGTPGDRVRLYVNGELAPGGWATGNIPSQNSRYYYNRTNNYHEIGHSTHYNAYYDGRMTQCYWIDGQSLGPENFGFSDPLTNTWRPKKYEQLGPNNGTTWSSGTTAGSIEAVRPWALGFDGREDTFTRPDSNQMASIMFDTPINFTSKFEIKGALDSGNTGSIEVYDGTDTWINVSSSFGSYSQSYDYPRVDITSSITSPVKGIRFNGVSAVYQPRFTGIYVDDQILIDGDTSNMGRNGFYLPMDGSAPIGKDQSGRENDWTPVAIGGSADLPKATGAIPVLNTNEAGTVAKPGVRTHNKTYTVTASGGKYYLNGALTPTLNAYRGSSLIFDYTGASSHPLYLSGMPDGKHNSKAYSVEFFGNDYLSVPDSDDFDLAGNDWTIEAWVYHSSTNYASYEGIMAQWTLASGTARTWVLESVGSGATSELEFYYNDTNNNFVGPVQGGKLSKEKWHHVAACRSGNTIRMFVDGVMYGSGTTINVDIKNSTDPLTVGGGVAGSGNWNGFVSNARLVNGTALYTKNFTPPGTTLTNVPNTKLLCCQDSNATTAAVLPSGSAITVNGSAAASQSKQPFIYDNNQGDFGLNVLDVDTTKITIPHHAADTLYYYCDVHSGMGSSINVTTDIFKADPYAWKCMFAMASDMIDHSPEINVNSTATSFGDIHTTTPQGLRNFYGHSKKMETGGGFRIDMELTTPEADAKHKFDTNDFTLECWFYQDGGNTSWQSLFRSASYNNSSLNSDGIALYANGQTLWPYSVISSSGQPFTQTGSVVPYKKWNHAAWTRQGNVNRIFANGTLVVTFNNSDSWNNKGWEIGDVYTWNGGYQDARIYNGVAKYTESFVVPDTAPDVLPDTPSGITGKTYLTKITDGGVYINRSSDQYIQAPASTDFRLDGQYCIEYFLNLTDYSNDSVYVRTFVLDGPTGDGGTTNIHLNVNPSTGVLLFWSGGGELISGTISLAGGDWHHVCLTRDSSDETRLFIDGVLSGSAPISTDYNLNSNQNRPRLGALGTTGGTTGYYSNWRITKGSIPTEYQTSTITNGTKVFDSPTEALTTTSQGATANDVKLIACQSNTEPGGAAVAPSISGPNTGTQWSSKVTSGSKFRSGYGPGNAFDGNSVSNINGTTACEINEVSFVEFDFGSGIPFTTLQMQCDDNNEGTVKVNGVDITNQLPTGSFTNTTITGVTSPLKKIRLDAVNANSSSVYLGSVTVDGVMLKDPLTRNGEVIATNFNPITDDINTIRGRETGYATLNPLILTGGATLSNGNLDIVGSSPYRTTPSTIGINSGKYYWEYSILHFDGGATDYHLGICLDNFRDFRDTWVLSTNYGWGYTLQGGLGYAGNSQKNLGSSPRTTGDIIAFAFDADVGEFYIYVNGSILNSGSPAYTGLTNGPYYPFVTTGTSAGKISCNFGQKPFKFPPPDGFQPLNLSSLLPENVIARPDQYVDAITYSGNSTSSNTITDLKFNSKPDFVWIKSRSGSSSPGSQNHYLMDSVRGANGASGTSKLYSNNNGAANSGQTATSNGVRFAYNGFELTTNNDGTNSNNNYVAWCWKAGGSEGTFNVDGATYATAAAAGLSAGTMTVTGASVGTKQGFSIVRYTGSGSAGSLAHGLGQKPTFWIIKAIDAATYPNWYAYTEQLDGSLDFMHFHTNEHKFDSAAAAPTSTTIGITSTLAQAVSWIVYMWHDVPGLQKFGSFTGNSSQNFVELGFRPAIVWVKRAIPNSSSDTSTNNSAWTIMDSTRLSYNGQTPNHLYANHTADEGKRGDGSGTSGLADMTLEPHSNGFYLNGPATETNSDTGKFIYCAWAEAPSINMYGAQANAR